MAGADARARADEPMAYFPHDSNAADDLRCRKLVQRWGFEGYGRWWRLCELLAAERGHAVSAATDEDLDVLADVLGFPLHLGAYGEVKSREDCAAFLEDLVRIGLLTSTDGGVLRSARMDRNALGVGTKKASGSKGGRPRKAPAEEG